jgi:cell division protein FtsB
MAEWKARNSFIGRGLTVKKVMYIIVIAAGVLALLKNGITYFSARAHKDALTAEIEQLKVKNGQDEQKLKGLYNDKELIEKKAREELGLVKDGETVIKFR